jgi:DNA modification methylase
VEVVVLGRVVFNEYKEKMAPSKKDLLNEEIFNPSVRISSLHPMDENAIWPMNTEICITRIPIRKRDGFDIEVFKKFAIKLKQHMVTNGIVFLICYAPNEAKNRPFEIAKVMGDVGFYHIDNIVIQKTWFPGKRSEVNLVNSHEYVLHFCNGNVWKLDRLPIRRYLKTEEEVSCPGNSWCVETGSLDESYPVDLAELLIRMTDCLPGSIVFDPFGGGTGSLKTALLLGHTFYSFNMEAKMAKKCNSILKEHAEKSRFKRK